MTRISLVVALAALALTIRDIGPRNIGHYLQRIGWWWFAVVALEITITSLDAVAIHSFLSPEQHLTRLRTVVLAQLAGRSVNAVTPSGNLGEAVKISVLTEDVSNSRAVATILLYNVVSFTAEFGFVAVAAPIAAVLVPMPAWTQYTLLVIGAVSLVIAIGLYALVRRGMLTSVARAALKIHVLSPARYTRWEQKLRAVDDKLRLVAGARRRDRMIGIGAVLASRATSYSLSLLVLHAVGEPLTLAFVAAYIVGSHAIYLVSSLVPMGLGISEGGNYWLFKALGENPARGVTLVIARRVTLVMYAALGLVLFAASETVRRARDRQRVPAAEPAPAPAAPIAMPLPTAAVVQIRDVAE
ncbi:MAG TPA: lysylphosphatidylglycerol synthase transmembrane domain-containing protein [Kofleriaceae bacterium]|nr:lysylphosphatidylglycerol synthase transmembrane domain-containing protein [Kofleriaceae bacterium]